MGRAIAYGTLAVGILDILDAFVFFGLRGVATIVILQSIASGVLGRGASQGGLGAAGLGLALHFFIAFSIVTTYLLAARPGRPWRGVPSSTGPCTESWSNGVMNLVVVPLSAAAVGSKTWPVVVNALLIHIFGVGLPSALAARAADLSSTEPALGPRGP